jgi:hypothetical protein
MGRSEPSPKQKLTPPACKLLKWNHATVSLDGGTVPSSGNTKELTLA